MELRDWTAGDLEEIARMEGAYLRCPWTRAMLEEELNNPNYRCLVCLQGEALCGYAGCWEVADYLEISNVVVDAPFRRRGVGGLLLDAILVDARERGLDVTLEVGRGNRAALGLYLSRGFREEGVRRHYYGDEDALILWRRFRKP